MINALASDEIEITKRSHYRQYDNYFFFDGRDPDADRLRYREDEFIDEAGEVYQARDRLTLLGQSSLEEYPNAAMLSRSRFLAPAEQSLRFYQEYFDPDQEIEVHKDRRRWRILYKDTDFAVNLDRITRPDLPDFYLEIKSRTWSRTDAERKASLISELLSIFGVDEEQVQRQEYAELALEHKEPA